MNFTEEKLEHAFIELLEQQGFPYVPGADIARKTDEVMIEDDMLEYLLNRYGNDNLTRNEANQIIRQLKGYASSDLYESNKTIMKMVSDGFILKREDRTQKDLYIQLIDYSGLTVFRDPDPERLEQVVAEGIKPDYILTGIFISLSTNLRLRVTKNEFRMESCLLTDFHWWYLSLSLLFGKKPPFMMPLFN